MNTWLARFEQVHPRVSLREHDPKFGPVFIRGEGSRLWDTEGRDYIDLTCGYAAANFGQAFPPLVAAATHQLTQLTHVTGEPHVGRIELAEQLLSLFKLGKQPAKVIFNSTGARAVETAWKAANAFRPGKIMTLGPCFHGRSLATSALGQSQPSAALPQLSEQVAVMPAGVYPYCAACPWQLQYPSCQLQCVDPLWASLEQQSASLSAVIVEPAIGARGYIFPPAEFFIKLRRLTAQLGILLIADEIQTGLGRCGHMSLALGQGWEPDLLILGKSLAGGMAPLSAVLGRSDVLECLVAGSESETYAASPMASAIALEVLHQLRDGELIKQGQKLGADLRDFARNALRQLAVQGQAWEGCSVEGEGASCVIEFRNMARGTGAQYCRQLAESCARYRLLTHFSGPELTRCVLLPALTMTHAEFNEAVKRLSHAITAVATNGTTDNVSSSSD
jgi:4-aminobutyrate aminotransferase/(S)-3-amino-2-methylpropionate transaminase